jgi:hypothetical protein
LPGACGEAFTCFVLPRLAKKTRVALSWVLEMIFSKDLEQMLTLRDIELISRIATSLRSDVAD